MASLRQLARLLGVDEKAVRKAEKAGVFKGAIRRDDRGDVLFLDSSAAVDLWEKSGRRLRGTRDPEPVKPAASSAPPAGVHPSPPPPSATSFSEAGLRETTDDDEADVAAADLPADAPPSLVEAQIASHQERTRKLRMENDLREGTLVEATAASRLAFEFARTVRENVQNVPARISAELAAESDAGRVHQLLVAALNEALATTSALMEAENRQTVESSNGA
jgi:hypothetical protein